MQPKKTTQHGFLSFYRPYKGLLAADLLCSALVAVLSLALPMCVRYITKDVLEAGSRDILSAVLPVTGIMLAIIALKTCFGMFQDYKGHDMGAKIERDMRHQLFAHYQKLSFDFFDNHQTGQLLSRMTNDTTDLAELYHHGPENLVVYGTQFIGAFVILLGMNARLTLLICAILPVMAAYSFIFYRKLQKSYAASREEIGNLNAFTEENLSGIRVVKSFTNEAMEIDRFRKINGRFYQCRRDVYKKEALHYTVMDAFFVNLISIAVIVGGAVWIARGALDFADLISFILYSAYLLGPIPNLAFMVQQYQEGISGYRRFREIVDTEPGIRDMKGAEDLQVSAGRVSFHDVSFRYGKEREYVLRKLSLEVDAGETVALVGVSGIGKTTLCSLIPRFYEAESGEIRIDGIDVRTVTQSSLRRQIGVVSQNNFLFAGTVMENILYGNPGASPKEAIAAAKAANAHEFILGLPQGYDSYVGEKGVMLSGGQKQRISIARVFLKNPPILIFDEATSALDYENEKAVMQSMRHLAQGKTTFIIAHRLSTLHSANRIVVLTENGIAEQGSHESLLKAGGVYAGLYSAQEL